MKKEKNILIAVDAGEVAEIMLQVMNDDNNIPLEVLAVVNMRPNNNKLVNRAQIIVSDLAKVNKDEAKKSLEMFDYNIKKALDFLKEKEVIK